MKGGVGDTSKTVRKQETLDKTTGQESWLKTWRLLRRIKPIELGKPKRSRSVLNSS